MAGFFSKEQTEKRQKKMYELGRIKFSIMFAVLFILLTKFTDLILDFIFEGHISLHHYITFKGLVNLLIGLIFMFLLAYYLFWNLIKYEVENKQR